MAASVMKITFLVLTLVVLVRAEDISEPDAVKTEGARRIVKRNVVLRGLTAALTKQLIEILGQTLVDRLNAKSVIISQPVLGSYWFSYLDGWWGTYNGILVSCFYHPTRKHSATTEGKLGVQRSVSGAGRWACSQQTRGLWNNKTYWNVL